MSRSSSKGLLAFAVVAVFAAGCNGCGNPIVVPKDQCKGVPGGQADFTNACTDNTDCAEHFGCKPQKDNESLLCCVFNDRACTTEADCCPGQTCPADRKKCFDKFIGCQQDSECGDRGDRFCEVYTDTYGTSSRCRFKPCGSLGECAEGLSCFQGECMADLPCLGTCAPGKGCVATIDRCQDYSMPTDRPMAACPMTCAPGFLATFKDPRNIWDSCVLPDVKCICAELPGLHSNDLGRFSAVSADPGNAIFVSAYDGQYGDLVVVKYGLDGKKLATEYVDGVPAAAVKYGPSGARGGIVEPGPDVGRYTDVAVSQGRVYVSYYDVTGGNLKVAVRSPTGEWTKHQVDGAQADLGLYTSIAIDSDGHARRLVLPARRRLELQRDGLPRPASHGRDQVRHRAQVRARHHGHARQRDRLDHQDRRLPLAPAAHLRRVQRHLRRPGHRPRLPHRAARAAPAATPAPSPA